MLDDLVGLLKQLTLNRLKIPQALRRLLTTDERAVFAALCAAS